MVDLFVNVVQLVFSLAQVAEGFFLLMTMITVMQEQAFVESVHLDVKKQILTAQIWAVF